MDDLIAASQVCRSWRTAIATMEPCNVSMYGQLAPHTSNVIGRHLGQYSHACIDDIPRIAVLSSIASHLHTLSVTLDDPRDEFFQLMPAFPRLTHLTVRWIVDVWVSLAPLGSCPFLKTLSVHSMCSSHISDAHVAEIRTLGHLDECVLGFPGSVCTNMQRILAPPHTLSWKNIGTIYDGDVVQLLPALPSLTIIHASTRHLSHTILAALPRLTSLDIMRRVPEVHFPPDFRSPITTLSLDCDVFGIGTYLTHFPMLHTLTLGCPESLQCMRTVSCAASLRKLSLYAPLFLDQRLHVVELSCILSLINLSSLTIDQDLFREDVKTSCEYARLCPPALPFLHTIYILDPLEEWY
jgi:hypothetical protein